MISLIAVLTINRVIGRENVIPWYFSSDLVWFKYHTMNKPIIMGRKTFESIGKKPLPNRLNVILSRKLLLSNILNEYNNIIVTDSVLKALSILKKYNEIMIIGGGIIYNLFLSRCTRMYLTYINVIYDYGDSWFPAYNYNEWKIVFNMYQSYKIDQYRGYELNFQIIERN